MDPENAARIRNLTGEALDWSHLLRLAAAHGLMPLLYWHLNSTCPESVPPSVLEELRDRFRANSHRNLAHAAELLELLKLFEDHGIPAIPYKGPVLAASVFGNLALRQFIDLDILVPKSRVHEARDLLLARGYRPGEPPMTGRQEASLIESGHELGQVHPTKQIGAEIQWEIVPRYMAVPIDLEQFRQRLVRVPFARTTVPGFAPEDLLLILCVHGTNHCWQRLDWVCGVSELIRRHPEIDWRQMMERAETLGCRRMLLLGLFLAADLLGPELPAGLLENIRDDRTVRSLGNQVRGCLFDLPVVPRALFATAWFHLRTRERARDWIRFTFRLATTLTPSDRQVADLPVTLHFLYYPIRLVRLVVKHGLRTALRRPAHDHL
jgi:hypothetical protein